MSDTWHFYPCSIGGHAAFIMLDTGISESVKELPPMLAKLRLVYKAPSENGLPTNEEYDAVSAVEDALTAFADEVADAYVGRVTTNGHRDFFVYTTRAAPQWRDFTQRLAETSGYELKHLLQADQDHQGYWRDLYPTPDDWRVIHDMSVIAQLGKSGDISSIHRQIDHWIYFPNEAASQPFVAWAIADRFIHDPQYSESVADGRYCVRLHHVGPADQRDVSSHTRALMHKAEERGGEYDGWETSVEKSTG